MKLYHENPYLSLFFSSSLQPFDIVDVVRVYFDGFVQTLLRLPRVHPGAWGGTTRGDQGCGDRALVLASSRTLCDGSGRG